MNRSADDVPDPALREAARTPEFWRNQIVHRIQADPEVSAQELFRTFEKLYRRRIAREIEERGLSGAAEITAALRSGELGRLDEPR